MRILQISHRHHIKGGSDAVFFATSDLLREAGHEVIPFCMRSPLDEPSQWAHHFPRGADTGNAPLADALRYFHNREAARRLEALLDECGPVDVAHLHIYHGKQTPAILPVLRRRGIAIVQSLHEYKLACPVYTLERDGAPCTECVGRRLPLPALRHRCKDGSLLRSAVMAAEMLTARLQGDVRHVDRFICVSDFLRTVMRRAGLPEHKLSVLHNFTPPAPEPSGPGHDGYLLYFGRLEALKGLPTLIDAARRSNHRLLIAGDGAWRAQMQARIEGHDTITWLGFRSGAELQELIARSRAVVVPSEWYENCPMSVLEAKALGRPVIGARIGGIPELVRDGKDGFLFEPGSTDRLLATLDRLNRADHAALSANALADHAARFSPGRHLDALLAIYNEARAMQRQPRAEPLPA